MKSGAVVFLWRGHHVARDIIVTEMDAPPASFLGDEVLVKVRALAGVAGQNGQLILTLNGNRVLEEIVAFGLDGEQEIPLRIKTDEAGGFDYGHQSPGA